MSYKRLSFLLFGQFVLLFPITFIIISIFRGNFHHIIAFIFLTAYFLYSLNFVKDEVQRIKKDKQEGLQEKIMILCNYNVLYKGINDNMPPISRATFRLYDKNEYVCLSGDYSNISMVEGKRYRVKYYSNSGIIADISASPKIKK